MVTSADQFAPASPGALEAHVVLCCCGLLLFLCTVLLLHGPLPVLQAVEIFQIGKVIRPGCSRSHGTYGLTVWTT
jgi:hypothetical protein